MVGYKRKKHIETLNLVIFWNIKCGWSGDVEPYFDLGPPIFLLKLAFNQLTIKVKWKKIAKNTNYFKCIITTLGNA